MWFDQDNYKQISFRSAIQSDLKRSGHSPPESLSTLIIIFKFLQSRTVRIIIWVQIATSFKIILIRDFARWRLRLKYNLEIASNVTIGEGFLLPHPIGIVIGKDVVLGDNVTIGQHVTLGGNFRKSKIINHQYRKITIVGNRVWIAAGAVVAGPVIIGDDVIIGSDSVVTNDVASHH